MPDPVPVLLPLSLWESDGTEEAVLAEWHAEDGEDVTEGDLLAEVMVDKVTLAIDAPASGRLEIRTPAEGPVAPGETIAVIHPR